MDKEQKSTVQIVPTEVLVSSETQPDETSSGLFDNTSKWRRTLVVNFCLAVLIFVVNVALFVWAWTRPGRENGLATVYTGSCASMSRISTGAHLAINILSTLLLAASNYAVQCLIAPTRRSLNSTHSRMRWLDIGLISFRNFKASSGRHKAIIVLLFVSSVPLHLV